MDKVRIKVKVQTNSGHRKGFYKLVTKVDESKNNGYAFIGDFLNSGTEYDVPIGSVLVEKAPEGSVKNAWNSGNCSIVGVDGIQYTVHPNDKKYYRWEKEFLSFRDLVAKVVAMTPDERIRKYTNFYDNAVPVDDQPTEKFYPILLNNQQIEYLSELLKDKDDEVGKLIFNKLLVHPKTMLMAETMP